MRTSTTALLLASVLGACGGVRNARFDYSKEPDPRRGEYVIGIADQLSIQVWKNPDLTTEASVRPDGTITMPLIGDLKADGRTPSRLRDEIAKQLAKYIRDESAVVTVAVTSVNSYTFTVSGNVERAGVFNAQKYVTVLEAIQLAGGPNRFASPRGMRLIRLDAKGQPRIIPIDYTALLEGKLPQGNLALLPGDQLHVP